MNNEQRKNAFTLAEVLLAVGILAIGMIFIAGVFPVGIRFTTIAAERTIAAVVADEAFAKIRLYGVDFASPEWPVSPVVFPRQPHTECVDFAVLRSIALNDDEFVYPSTDTGVQEKHYYWSALCRYTGGRNVQVTVFISRKIGAHARYRVRNHPGDTLDPTGSSYPVPISVNVLQIGPYELKIIDADSGDEADEETFINDGYKIVDNQTGRIYRVLKRYAPPDDAVILLDRPWQGGDQVWVVPPPASGGRYPCIAIYQKVIRF